jgi:hypothetical protein
MNGTDMRRSTYLFGSYFDPMEWALKKGHRMAVATTPTQPTTILRLDTQAPHYKWLVAAIVLLAGGTQTFGGTSVNIAIPRLMAAFGTDLATAQWVVTGFFLTRILVMPLLGWLGGLLGYRNMFAAIMVGDVVTSIGCG